MKLVIAHTPDADDAFMFYAMVSGKIPLDFEIEHVVEDIEMLNKKAFNAEFDVTAISVHAYAYLVDKYRILSTGASVGDGYGPIVVAREDVDLSNLTSNLAIAVPGKLTTGYLLLRLAVDKFKAIEMKFDEILRAVKTGKVDAGLIIHEGQITYVKYGLKKVFDLWEWWYENTKLPLPLGINVIRRKLDIDVQKKLLRALRESVKYALENPDEATRYAMIYSRGMDFEMTKKFAMMYVNRYTLEMSENVKKGIEKLYRMAEEKGLFQFPSIDLVEI